MSASFSHARRTSPILALRKGNGRAARAGIEHRNILVERGDELAGFGLAAARLLERVTPRREEFQRAPPEVLGLGVTTETPGFTRSSQSLMPLGLPLRTRNTMVEV